MRRMLWLGILPLALTGCVDRFINVRTEPPGAAVTLDGQPAGVTPCDVPFVFYGGREIVIEKKGYVTQTHIVDVPAPWYQWPVFDFLTDVILPFTVTDRRVFEYRLETVTTDPASIDDVLRHAEELRRKALSDPE